MDIKDYQKKIKSLMATASVQSMERITVAAANGLYGAYIKRIFVNGSNSSGGDIGTYQRYSAYFSRAQFSNEQFFEPRGKFGGAVSHRMMYFQDGYAGGAASLKAVQGLDVKKVNAYYTGSLMRAVKIVKGGDGRCLIGIQDTDEAAKSYGFDDRYGSVFEISENEIKKEREAAIAEIRRIFANENLI